MRYCALSDLQAAVPERTLIELTNDTTTDYGTPPPTAINVDIVESAVRQAEEIVDAHLRGRYNLPLSPVPTVIKDVTVNLARHWLYARRPEGAGLPETVSQTFKASMHMLEKIRDNKLTIGDPSGAATPEPGEMKVRARRREFGSDLLERY
ncbi:hypothetical protein WM34_29575 [Burkholderia ubonensis]|uniref:gp436 family protein n=1 Tax=Burkholderia ubonensis TaxID=101571 RepID=UPI0007548D12|nr:DUF1320 domain-containing protein [Burkholderia ubonensis]KVO25406.1 hypothetical protein WJ74_30355 [Burkholderia ubonensis]KWD09679.1 hypothetical protein WL59_03535 [Burkholderia ubonensis]KWD13275.1 hypothetical protein WL60_17495 [Burkholderia ubonensis]KWQ01067.1 hypothetical protein WM34_29575 [Burkholderia ubonensis]